MAEIVECVECHRRVAWSEPSAPTGWFVLLPPGESHRLLCSWDCVMVHAADKVLYPQSWDRAPDRSVLR